MSSLEAPSSLVVLLFGPLSLRARADRVRVPVSAVPTTCAALRVALEGAYPELTELLPLHRFAINGHFQEEGATVGPGDEVALIGMVSGG
jgi:molybdopterin converting factor small subunit